LSAQETKQPAVCWRCNGTRRIHHGASDTLQPCFECVPVGEWAAADESAKASDADNDRVRLQRMVRELLRLVGLQNKWAMAKTEEALAQTDEEKVQCRVRQLTLTRDINEVMAGVEKLSNHRICEE